MAKISTFSSNTQKHTIYQIFKYQGSQNPWIKMSPIRDKMAEILAFEILGLQSILRTMTLYTKIILHAVMI